MSLQGRKILLGVTGGIAAYKAPEIVRQLTVLGAEVRVAMSRTAHEFVAEKTLGVLERCHAACLWGFSGIVWGDAGDAKGGVILGEAGRSICDSGSHG